MIFFSCRRAAELVSKAFDARLSLAERVGASAHRLVCSPCRRYRTQMNRVEQSVRDALSTEAEVGDTTLSDTVKARIAAEIERR